MIVYKKDLDGIESKDLSGFFVEWKKPLSQEQHYQILKNSYFFILAYDSEKNQVVGFINALSDNVSFAFIPMLEVLPEYQNQGIGTKLMNKMLDLLTEMTCIDLTCDKEMQKFYSKFNMINSQSMVIRKYLNK